MRSLAFVALASSLAALAACTPSTPPSQPPAPTAAPVAPEASAAPNASASAAPAAPEAASPFFPVIVHAGGTLHFHRLKHGAAVIAGEYISEPVLLGDGGARREPRLYEGLKGVGDPPAFAVYRVDGDWPRSGTLSLNLPGERGGTDVDYAWTGSAWVKAPSQPLGDMTQQVVESYYMGGLLGRAQWNGHALYYLMGSRFVPAKGTKGKLPAIAPGQSGCEHRLVGYAKLVNAGGDLLGIGKLCTGADDPGMDAYMQTGKGALAVERWAKGQTKSTIVELPGSAGKGDISTYSVGYHEGAGGDTYVYVTFTQDKAMSVYVARWDGKAWADVSPAADERVQEAWSTKDGSLWLWLDHTFLRRKGGAWERLAPSGVTADIMYAAAAPDGSLWAIYGEQLWHFTAAGAWEQAVLPRDGQGAKMTPEWVTFLDGEMLIGAHGSAGGDNYLLSSKKPDAVLDLTPRDGDAAAKEAKRTAFGRVGPPTAGCKNLFVVLYKLSRVAPPDFDFPLTRAALKGHTELSDVRFAETEDAGTRYLVAFVPSLKRGKALADLVKEKVQGSSPQLLCGEPPKTNRAIEIDLRTGAIKK
jgi:hypothetical protein